MYKVDQRKDLLGTTVKVVATFDDKKIFELIDQAFLECERIEKSFSRFIDSGELFNLNNNLGKWMTVSNELYGLIKYGIFLKENTEGAFDLTVKSVLDSWGYDKDYSFKESGALSLGNVQIADDNMVKIESEIDLGGFGKGYAVDRMANILKDCKDFCVNAGGDIFAKGHNPEGKAWRVLFEHPLDNSQAIGYVDTCSIACASSSANRRKWKDKHHLVDARRLRPADDMLAVYTQAKSTIDADAYATAFFVSGYSVAIALEKNFPVEAMFVSKTGDIYRSKGFEGELF